MPSDLELVPVYGLLASQLRRISHIGPTGGMECLYAENSVQKTRLLEVYKLMYICPKKSCTGQGKEAGMRETTVAELRKHTKECFDSVERGEVIRVYRRGRPVAEIVPLREKRPSWKDPISRLTMSGLSLAEEILADREEARR